MRHLTSYFVAASLFAVTSASVGQTLTEQIDRVREGTVRLSFDTRPEVCGDGRSIGEETAEGFVFYNTWNDGFSIQMFDHWMPDCRTGPLRLVVVKSAGRVVELRAAVGVQWLAQAEGTDLGMVSGSEAANWLLVVGASGNAAVSRIAFLAANAAQGAAVADRVMRLIRDRSLPLEVRASAMRWVGGMAAREGKGLAADQLLREMATTPEEPLTVREAALRRLRATPENAAWLRALALNRSEQAQLRDRAIRLLTDDPMTAPEVRDLFTRLDQPALQDRLVRVVADWDREQDRDWLRALVLDRAQALPVRDRALRVLGDRDATEARTLFERVDAEPLQDRALRLAAVSGNGETAAWLEKVATSPGYAPPLRDRALRLLAERAAESNRLADLYDRVDRTELKHRVLRLLAERADDAAIERMIAVAVSDPNPDTRRFALRRLGESGHPRARRFLEERVTQPPARNR
ncbi:MAG TPA: HEAT repeat domain-containing protein [Gemmatimonadales bacterium]|nr:HEAT repeat domain-containing protein [Gemmatimonadales bacterium]